MHTEAILDHVRKLVLAQHLLDQANAGLAELEHVEGLPGYLSRMSLGLEDVVEHLKRIAERRHEGYETSAEEGSTGDVAHRALQDVSA